MSDLFNQTPKWSVTIDFEKLLNEGKKPHERLIYTGDKIYSVTKGDTTHDFLHHVSSTDDILYAIRTTGDVAIIFYDLYSGIDTIGSIIEIPDEMIEDMKSWKISKIDVYKENTAYVIKLYDGGSRLSVSYKLYCHSKPEPEEGMMSRVACKILMLSEDRKKYIERAFTDLHGKENYEINKLEFL